MEKEKRSFKIGEVYFMEFCGRGNEQNGWRPGVVFQNDIGNEYSPNIIALPLTTAIKKAGMPTHVVLPSDETGLPKDSMVLCENPECISKARIGEYITRLPDSYMEKIAEANIYATSAIAFINPESLIYIWQKASTMVAAKVGK